MIHSPALRRTSRVSVLLACLLTVAAAAWASIAHARETLGISTAALVDGDATDPEGDGVDACVVAGGTLAACGFDAIFTANNRPEFANGGAFNAFDNSVSAPSPASWCCDAPALGTDDPQTAEDETGSLYVRVELAAPIVLHAFTLASALEVTLARTPDVWKIQGSADGVTYTDIYSYAWDGVSPFDRNIEVNLYRAGRDYLQPPPYRFFRYRVFSTVGGTQHELAELELFQSPTTPQTIATSDTCSLHDAILAANRGLRAGGCTTGSVGFDTIVLDRDVEAPGPDIYLANNVPHGQHTDLYAGAAAGLPDVTDALEIAGGPGITLTTGRSGCSTSSASNRLLTALAPLTLRNLELQRGCVAPFGLLAAGGAVAVRNADLTVVGSTFGTNTARSGDSVGETAPARGGAIHVDGGSLTVSDSLFSGNTAFAGTATSTGGEATGGAIHVVGGMVQIIDTEFVGNHAQGGSAPDGVRGGAALGSAAWIAADATTIERVTARINFARGGDGGDDGGGAHGTLFTPAHVDVLRDVWMSANVVRGGSGTIVGGSASGGGYAGQVVLGERITADYNVVDGGNTPVGPIGIGGGSAAGGGLAITASTHGAALRNVTLAYNQSNGGAGYEGGDAHGGGLATSGALAVTLRHATIAGNTIKPGAGNVVGDAAGAGVAAGGALGVGHSILQSNETTLSPPMAAVDDCATYGAGSIASLDHNRIRSTGFGCTFGAASDLVGVDVPTGMLGDHDCVARLPGDVCVPVLPLESGSALAADAGACGVSGVATDARGFARPVDLPAFGDGVADCDIGATEESDGDGDGAFDSGDNCPAIANPAQVDTDLDGLGDACDACRSSHAPVFTSFGPFVVAPTSPLGAFVGDVDAENGAAADEGIVFAFRPGDEDGPFAIDAATGVLTVTGSLEQPTYTFRVIASDCESMTETMISIGVRESIFLDGFE